MPGGFGVRFDSHAHSGYIVPPYYDSMIGKLIVHQPTRAEAIATHAAGTRRTARRRHQHHRPAPPGDSQPHAPSSKAASTPRLSNDTFGCGPNALAAACRTALLVRRRQRLHRRQPPAPLTGCQRILTIQWPIHTPLANASRHAKRSCRHNFRRVAILFAGGPAPAANAVISTAAIVVPAQRHRGAGHPARLLQPGAVFGRRRRWSRARTTSCSTTRCCSRTRNSQGILIGTARANPGKHVSHPSHLDDPERAGAAQDRLRRALLAGRRRADLDRRRRHAQDGQQVQAVPGSLPPEAHRIPVVHLPKTIDNDYRGIDFTFGYFTAVDFLASEVRNCSPTPKPTAATSWPKRWAAAPAGWPTASPSPARPAW